MVRIGSLTTNTVADDAEVSTGEVQIRVLNCCFGVSMLGRWMNAGPEVNRSETPYRVRTCQVVSERVRAIGRRRQRLVETPPPGLRLRRVGRDPTAAPVGQSGHSLGWLSVGGAAPGR